MQNEFGEQMNRQVVTKKKSWPIKLAMKCGAKTESQANMAVIVISLACIFGAILIYKNTFFEDSSPNIELTPQQIEALKQM